MNIKYLIKKYSYPNGQHDYLYDNSYTTIGMNDELVENQDIFVNKDKSGIGYDEHFKPNKKHNKCKRCGKMIQPHPFYSSLYGYTGFEGAMSSPLEYYSGSITDEPGDTTNNPYNTVYQLASGENERITIRSMILKDFIKI